MVIGPATIHFDDRPWSVCGYIYDNDKRERYKFIIPELVIFDAMNVVTLEQEEMVDFAKNKTSEIEEYCNKLSQTRMGQLKDGDIIFIHKL